MNYNKQISDAHKTIGQLIVQLEQTKNNIKKMERQSVSIDDLCIISSNYRSAEILNKNYELVVKRQGPIKWLVVCNDGDTSIGDQYIKIEGVPKPKPCPPKSLTNHHSMHHALGVHKALEFIQQNPDINSRFILMLDPDFLVIPDFLDVMRHMIKYDLTFFGAPYWKQHNLRRVWNFPILFCQFIDTSKIDISTLDYRPTYSTTELLDTGHRICEEHANKTRFETVELNKKLAKSLNCDCYNWNGIPFGFHIHFKGHVKKKSYIKIQEKRFNNICKVYEKVKRQIQ